MTDQVLAEEDEAFLLTIVRHCHPGLPQHRSTWYCRKSPVIVFVFTDSAVAVCRVCGEMERYSGASETGESASEKTDVFERAHTHELTPVTATEAGG